MALSIKKQGINFEIDQGCTFSKTFTAKNANNVTIETEADSIIDFSESNPFSESNY